MSNTLQGHTFAVGDLVTVDPSMYAAHFAGVVFRVTKVPVGAKGVNYVCERADGVVGRGIRGPAYALRPHDPSTPTKSSYAVLVEEMEINPCPATGTVVTVSGISKINPNTPYVVTAESRKGGARLVMLGGTDGGRYWPSIPVRNLTVVPLADLAALLS